MRKYWHLRICFWLRIILLLCGLLANAIVLNNYREVGSDFVQDYIAANSLWRGGSLYGEDITKLENEMTGFGGIENFHPPFNALLFFPFSFFPYDIAFVTLGVFSILLLLLLLIILFFLSLPDVLIARGLMVIHHPFRMPWYSILLTLGPGVGLLFMWMVFCRRLSISKF